MTGLWWFCARAIDSRVHARWGTRELASMAVMRGRDFGLSATAALEMLQIIEDKITLPAQLLVAMAKRNPDCEYWGVKEASPLSVTIETKRKGTPFAESVTYTFEQAKAAGLVKPRGGYERNPEDMLIARAGSKLARRVYPDSTCGAYSFEEMQD